MKDKRNKKLLKNTVVLSFGNLCTKGIMFMLTPLLTRWLTQSDYGTFDLITTYCTLLIPFISLDIGEACFRFLVSDDNKDDKSIISSAIIVALIGFLLLICIFIPIYIIKSSWHNILPYFLLLLSVESINNFLVYIARGFKKLSIYTLSNILFVVTMAISSFIYVKVLNMTLNGIVLSYSTGYIFSIIFLIFTTKIYKYFSIKNLDLKLLKNMLSFSLPLMPNAISWWIINVSDRTIVSKILGISTNAVYSVANKIPNLCQTFFNVFHISWQENAIENLVAKDRDIYYSNIMNKMIQIMSSISLVILALNFLIYKLLFTKEYFNGYYQVPILIVSLIVSMLAQFLGGIYIANMESKKNGFTTVMAAIINITTHLLLIKHIGLYAATISTLISYMILFFVRYIDITRKIKLNFDKKTIYIFLITLYFILSSYIINIYLQSINLLISILVFIIYNKSLINMIIRKILKIFNIERKIYE